MKCLERGCDGPMVHLESDHGILTDEFCSWACLAAYAARHWYGDQEPRLPVKMYQGYNVVNSPTIDLNLLLPHQRAAYDEAYRRGSVMAE